MASDHRRHDRLLVARLAGGDAYPGELSEARSLVVSCPDCAALAEDIRALSHAVGQLPAMPRARDFRLSAEQAEQVRGSRLERLMRRLSGPGWGTVRPLAGVAISIGLVLSVIGAMPFGTPAGGPPRDGDTMSSLQTEDERASLAPGDALSPGDAPSPADPPREPQDGPAVVDNGNAEGAPGAQASPAFVAEGPLDKVYLDPPADPESEPPVNSQDVAGSTPNLTLYAGIAVGALGLGLLLLVSLARRRFSDPLLR